MIRNTSYARVGGALLTTSLTLLAIADAPPATPEPPDALRRLDLGRKAIQTAQLDYRRTRWLRRDPDLADPNALTQWQAVSNYSLSKAGDDLLLVNRGDDEGVLLRDTHGARSILPQGVRRYVRDAGRLWAAEDGQRIANAFTADKVNNFMLDPRAIGVQASVWYTPLEDALYRDVRLNPPPRQYTESTEGDLRVVTAEAGNEVTRWWIDPRKGWNAVRVTFDRDGAQLAEARMTLREFDGIWFPAHCHYFVKGWKDGKEPVETLEIRSATFNRPDHARDFSPADIGVEVGTTLEQKDNDLTVVATGFYDGREFVEMQEYLRRRKAETVSGAPDMAAKAAALCEKNERWASDWERYVREFIARYQLDDAQQERAWLILRECQDRAERAMAKRKDTLDKALARLNAARAATEPERRGEIGALAELLDKLLQPLDAIFEEQLKPNLEKLPTRRQRAATQPAAAP